MESCLIGTHTPSWKELPISTCIFNEFGVCPSLSLIFVYIVFYQSHKDYESPDKRSTSSHYNRSMLLHVPVMQGNAQTIYVKSNRLTKMNIVLSLWIYLSCLFCLRVSICYGFSINMLWIFMDIWLCGFVKVCIKVYRKFVICWMWFTHVTIKSLETWYQIAKNN